MNFHKGADSSPFLPFHFLPFPFSLGLGPLNQLGSVGENCKLPQRDPRQSRRPKTNLVHSKAIIKRLMAIILDTLSSMFCSNMIKIER